MTELRAGEKVDFERYRDHIQYVRNIHKGVIGKGGRRARGPRFYAIVRCQECNEIGMTDSAQNQKKRWVCWTCGGCRLPIWADGPTPDEDDIWEMWAGHQKDDVGDHDYLAMKGHAEFVRQNGCSVKRQGNRCAWCETPLREKKVKIMTRREMMKDKGAKDIHWKPGPGLDGPWYPCAKCDRPVDPIEWRAWIESTDAWWCIQCTVKLIEAHPELEVSGGKPVGI